MKHEAKTCPRCLREFECKSGSVMQCQCSTVVLSLEDLEFINAHYDDCLCATCLAVLKLEARKRRAGTGARVTCTTGMVDCP
jgi:hypothetical protein